MKPLKYKELMPRVAIEKIKLISTDDLLDLVGKSPDAIRCALLETSYRNNILGIPSDEFDSISMEEALLENYAQTLNKLVKYSGEDVKNVLLAVVEKLLISNVKTLLRVVKTEMDINEAIKHIIPIGSMNKDQYRNILASSSSFESVVELLATSDLDPDIREVIVQNKVSEKSLLRLELALDRAAYRKIFGSIEKLEGLDNLITKNVLGIEADAINLKLIFRCKMQDLPKDQVKKYFMPSFVFNEEVLENALELPDIKSVAEYMLEVSERTNNPFYRDMFARISKQCKSSLSQLENILEVTSLKTSLNIMKKYLKYYNIGYVLAFLNLKWFEIRNLRCLIIGSERGIAADLIKSFLALENNL
jgi:vacuolar-type H+-ATPase subunit C/Vma6